MSHTNIDQTLAEAMRIALRVAREPRNPDCLDALEDTLKEALAEVTALRERSFKPVDLRFLSPVPFGYDTVLGYLAKNNPGLLELIDKVPEATRKDGLWLIQRAREDGLEVIRVDACAWLREQDILTVNAYPVRLLIRRLG